ncbi:MerR family transcriptional regulator [Mammaliicoccus sp. Dog046]|uniref:MerR family transcriptional regulator n=1 Tax=Mammaliicoccus sp. Dog046 TaxID=3034233 RepID=UPI002B25FDAD|nr:MerR family transcriptional regulator [Mammaliicoccus sp. Dog046]WQK84411.1 MerR family transcriptional regulator [Mammaliicoccus sp. Dog046]
MKMTVKEVSNLVGISVRTLHHYDKINLLKPSMISEAGYRLYSEDNIDRLQQILFFKALDFPLKKIKSILDDPSFDKQEALFMHKRMLLEKKTQIEQIIQTIEQTEKHLKGEINMTNEEKFKGFNFNDDQYQTEARSKWGEQTVEKANEQINQWSNDKKSAKEEEMNDIFRSFAEIRTESAHSEKAQLLVQRWYNYLNSNINYNYTLEIFNSLGEMYTADERFTKNIDQFGEGTAEFISKAISIYVKNYE